MRRLHVHFFLFSNPHVHPLSSPLFPLFLRLHVHFFSDIHVHFSHAVGPLFRRPHINFLSIPHHHFFQYYHVHFLLRHMFTFFGHLYFFSPAVWLLLFIFPLRPPLLISFPLCLFFLSFFFSWLSCSFFSPFLAPLYLLFPC